MKIVLFANTEWYLYNFRRSLATRRCGMRGMRSFWFRRQGPTERSFASWVFGGRPRRWIGVVSTYGGKLC
jgi:hypothetical protein